MKKHPNIALRVWQRKGWLHARGESSWGSNSQLYRKIIQRCNITTVTGHMSAGKVVMEVNMRRPQFPQKRVEIVPREISCRLADGSCTMHLGINMRARKSD